MTQPIGYYVHHHGDGHRQRALALARQAGGRLILLGTGLSAKVSGVQTIDLPDDRIGGERSFSGEDGTLCRPKAFHYAPLNHEGVRSRMSQVAQWIAQARPALMVVDVSVEVAMLARLCATRVAFVRLNGLRNDTAHLEAFRAASLLVAPFASQLDDPRTSKVVRAKTTYCPGIVSALARKPEPAPRRVLVVAGTGGAPLDSERVAAIASATPSYSWRVIGPSTPPKQYPPNLEFAGWVENALEEITAAGIVVGAAGDGLVSAVIAAGRPFICSPEPRPFDEQIQKARALGSAGAALVMAQWPAPSQWQKLLSDAKRLDGRNLTALGDPEGAVNTVRKLEALADSVKNI